MFDKTGLAYLHTTHCLANGDVMISSLGTPEGERKGIKGVFIWWRASPLGTLVTG